MRSSKTSVTCGSSCFLKPQRHSSKRIGTRRPQDGQFSIKIDDRDVDIINRNRAHLLYKQEGYERVFNKLDSIIKPLRKNAAETLTPATPATQATQSTSAAQAAGVAKHLPHLAR